MAKFLREAGAMDIEGTLLDVRSFMRNNADPAIAEKYRKYFVEGYDPYGVDSALIRKKVQEIKATRLDIEDALKLGTKLLSSGKYEEGHVAISLIKLFEAEFKPDTFSKLEAWFDIGISNWAHDDGFCLDVLSAFLTRGIVSLECIAAWRVSNLKYKRRALPVSLIKAVGNPFGPEAVIAAIEPLMTDSEKTVQQGVGWLLRETWKKHPEQVENLLAAYRQTGARVIYQYATEKMTPEQKERFRREKRAR